jgi:ABC-type antimicrobial peptide transport system permease subunit
LTIEESPGSEVYLPISQKQTGSPSLVVRTDRPFAEVAPALRAALAEVAPELPTSGFRPLQRLVDRATSPRRFLATLLVAFAGVALALAAIGIYGVISYSVAQRTPEFGIRMALGATGRRVQSGVLGDTLRITLIGAAIGMVGAIQLSSLLASLLFGISSTDLWTYAGAVGVLLLVALSAGFIPAFRASRLSPTLALRAD